MAKSNFSIQPLLDKGYVLDEKTGTLTPPKINSPFIAQQRAKNEGLIVKEKVVETPDFTAKINTSWEIKGNTPSKKNSKRIIQARGRAMLIPSKLHEDYKKATAMQYQVFGIEFRRAVKFYGLEYPLRVEFTFVRGSKHRADFTNALDTVQDIMVSQNWIPDDDMLHIIPSFQPMQYDKNKGSVIIKLLIK